MKTKTISLKLKTFGSYFITSKGVVFFTEHDFSVFVPKSIIKQLEG